MLFAFAQAGGDLDVQIPTLGQRGSECLMHIAATRGNLHVLRTLLGLGAEINATNSCGETPLMKIVDAGEDHNHRQAFHLLLERHADISIHDNLGRTALMRASAYGQREYAELLLKAGADPNARDKQLNSALHAAFTADVVHLLKGAGADINALNASGKTPLDTAEDNPSARDSVPAIKECGGTNTTTR